MSSGRFAAIVEAFFTHHEHLLGFVTEHTGTLGGVTGIKTSTILNVVSSPGGGLGTRTPRQIPARVLRGPIPTLQTPTGTGVALSFAHLPCVKADLGRYSMLRAALPGVTRNCSSEACSGSMCARTVPPKSGATDRMSS